LIFTAVGALALVAVVGLWCFPRVPKDRSGPHGLAALWAKDIYDSCQRYRERVGNLPAELGDLKNPPDGGPPLVDAHSGFNDPWGQPYQMERYTKIATGEVDIRIWTISPFDSSRLEWPPQSR
jgi:hypothetical protein